VAGKGESRYHVSTTHRQKLVGFFKKPSHFQKADCRQKSRVIFKKPTAGFLAPKIAK
jgi:hypothetical protein